MSGVKGRSGGARLGTGPKKGTLRTRGSVWMVTRARILARDNGLCQCEQCHSAENPLSASEVDHRVPLWEGGEDNDANLQALSSECHKLKSALEAERKSLLEYSIPCQADNPVEFLIGVMNDPDQHPNLRVRAGIAAAQYLHTKLHDGGKKDAKSAAAKAAGEGRFASAAPPKLVVNNR